METRRAFWLEPTAHLALYTPHVHLAGLSQLPETCSDAAHIVSGVSRLIIDHFSQPLLLLRGQVGPVAKHPPPSAPANHVEQLLFVESRFAPSCFVLFTEALVKG